MGFSGAAHGWRGRGGEKGPTPKNLLYISCNDETWQSYTLPKVDAKKI